MKRTTRALYVIVVVATMPILAGFPNADLPKSTGEYIVTGAMASPLANQAAAVDAKFVYVVDNGVVAKHDRATGTELARSAGKAEHLNSGFLWQNKLYCAHSNYPKLPHQSNIRVLDPVTMKLEIFHAFDAPPGSLTWAVRRGEHWWCCFAHYGKDNDKSVLVEYGDNWKEVGRWAFPKELVADWGAHSLSGGIWLGDDLLATGHDKKVIYKLQVPKEGSVVKLVEVIPSPFPGQGIAVDPKTGGLVGIDRAKRQVLFAKFESKGVAAGVKKQAGKSLFNGKDLTGWKFRGGEKAAAKSKWSVVGRAFLDPTMPNRLFGPPGTGVLLNGDDGRGVDLLTELQHGDCELHIEFNVPKGSNSGVYFQGQYEVQILDSFGKPDKDLKYGDCGGIYNTAAPKTNASSMPGEWQTFDVTFRAPRFDDKGKKVANARFVKVVHDGVVIHENVEVKGPTTAALGGPERPLGLLMLQGDHGPVAFRKLSVKLPPASNPTREDLL